MFSEDGYSLPSERNRPPVSRAGSGDDLVSDLEAGAGLGWAQLGCDPPEEAEALTDFDPTCGGLWLTPTEIVELTATERWSLQCQRLETMGIPYLANAAGRPLVERKTVLTYPKLPTPPRKKAEPYWGPLK
jgi:hypothetical protein